MKSLVYRGKLGLVCEETPKPIPAPGQVLLRISNCGICGSDLFLFKNGILRDGTVMGHELSGVVEEMGEGASGCKPGDKVIARPQGCGECKWCLERKENICNKRRSIGLGGRPGGFAEFMVADLDMIIPAPEGLPLEQACMADQFGSALHGMNAVGFRKGEKVLVTGAGPIGLSAVILLKHKGASKVVVFDPDESRASTALEFGADAAVSTGSIQSASREHFGADGPDIILECSGNSKAVEAAIQTAPFGGRIGLVGMASAPATFIPMLVFQKHLTIIGCFGNTQDECRECMDIMAAGAPAGKLITKRVSIEQLPAAFDELLKSKEQTKIVMDASL
ncbi:MAG TPA: alcohol dehydrogenase catalytic domain-containing protein [bacterium]|nr:alcohol dehydrogenase catalytic domain-containing protein [bacterium]